MPRRKVEVLPATPERWADLETLFGPRGACGSCWCSHWREKQGSGEANKAALRALVATGQEPGLLAYIDGQVAGWVSVGPRADYARLSRSRTLAPIDAQPVWSIPCFFVDKAHRRQGLMRALVEAAVAYARARGATLLEGYPLDMDSPQLAGQRLSGDGGYMGLASVFQAAGFTVVKEASTTQRIMRRRVRPSRLSAP
ncbi:MAG: GNAT family N-acetyltransferase [Anaerolineales bacterium]|nr:GNAT family N-acetyltransferase [Anaerolineales bacterium]